MEKELEELKKALITAAKGEYKSKLFNNLSMADTVLLDCLYDDISGKNDGISGKQLKEIAEELHITRPALTQQVNKLEARRIIRRVVSQSGKRASYIKFTEYGLELYKRERQSLEKNIKDFVQAFGESDCEELIRLMRKLESIASQ